IMLQAGRDHAVCSDQLAITDMDRLEGRYGIEVGDIDPRVYWQIGSDWLELTVRFLSPDHGTRRIKDKMTRDILAELGYAGIGIASTSYEITSIPPLRIQKSP
ncbi:MAG TPA: hypothetical protein VFQ06_11935, partial [Nitrospira sp.]|nr:hypothetical protein [Nitrospira sp.]